MSTYRVTVEDGRKVEIQAGSAAQAIERALIQNPTKKVIGCYSGLKQEDVDFIRSIDSTARPLVGWVDHEIPNHQPAPVKVTREPRPEDKTVLMFNDYEILSESIKALEKRA